MVAHSATITVDTNDIQAVRTINGLNRAARKHASRSGKKENVVVSDREYASFMKPLRRQLESLERRMKIALLDLDTPLGEKV